MDLLLQPPVTSLDRQFSVNGLSQLVNLCTERGVAAEPLLRSAGIDPAQLLNPHASINAQQEFRFLQRLQVILQDPAWGLLAGRHYRLGALGLLGTAVNYCGTARQAVRFFLQHIALSYTYFQVDFDDAPLRPRLLLRDQCDLGELRRYFLDRDLLFGINACRDVLPQLADRIIHGVHFAYPKPAEAALYERLIGCPVYFGSEVSMVELDGVALDLPLPQANPLTLQLLEEQCRSLEGKLQSPQRLADSLRRLLLEAAPNYPSLEEIAVRQHMTVRTLRRRLNQEGVNFQDLLHEVRQLQARRLLQQAELSLEQIAARLGYAEAASFIHAFKKWTGLTPGQFRKQQG